jgi:hypothetical protein
MGVLELNTYKRGTKEYTKEMPLNKLLTLGGEGVSTKRGNLEQTLEVGY